MCKTVTDGWKEFTGLHKSRDVTLTEDWTKLEMCKTVTDCWKEFTGLDKPGDVTLTEDWTEFTGLDKTRDV